MTPQISGVQSSSSAELLQTYTPGTSAPQVLSNLLHVLTTASPLKVLTRGAQRAVRAVKWGLMVSRRC